MATIKITRGNDLSLKFTIATTRAITRARFVAKRKEADSDGFALFSKQVTTTLSADGQITQQGGSGAPALMTISLTKTETAAATADVDYICDLEVFDASNIGVTPFREVMRFTERVRTSLG
jgi:hypothetical protein